MVWISQKFKSSWEHQNDLGGCRFDPDLQHQIMKQSKKANCCEVCGERNDDIQTALVEENDKVYKIFMCDDCYCKMVNDNLDISHVF